MRDVSSLFLWVYGWVGLAIVCAIIGPAWQFLDPFSTLHDLAAAAPAGGPRPGLGHRRLSGATRALARHHRLRLLRLARAGGDGRTVDAVHRPRRLYGLHAGDDGPVRARRVALARRDVHGLVPAAGPAGLLPTRGRDGARPLADVRERAAGAGLERRRRDARGVRRLVDHLRRPVPDRGVLRPVRRAGCRRPHVAPDRVARDRRRPGLRGRPDGRARRDRRGAAPDRARLSHRPLPDVPAHRRAADHHRHLRSVPEGLGPVRHGLLHADRGLAAGGPRVDGPACRRGRWSHARRVGRSRRRRGRCAARDHGPGPPVPAASAGGRDGQPDDAHPVVARPGDHRGPDHRLDGAGPVAAAVTPPATSPRD